MLASNLRTSSPALNRAAFLIERACVPRYYPPNYCAEAAQLSAMLDAAREKNGPQEHGGAL